MNNLQIYLTMHGINTYHYYIVESIYVVFVFDSVVVRKVFKSGASIAVIIRNSYKGHFYTYKPRTHDVGGLWNG